MAIDSSGLGVLPWLTAAPSASVSAADHAITEQIVDVPQGGSIGETSWILAESEK